MLTVSETQLTKETYERLRQELEGLKTKGRIDIANAIEQARALGDLSENGDYHAAKDSQGKMEARIRQLEAMLLDATIVDSSNLTDDTVSTGSIVGIRYNGDTEVEYYLVGSIEEKREDVLVVSPQSPLGKALIGHKIGAKVIYEAPNGTLEVEIVNIRL